MTEAEEEELNDEADELPMCVRLLADIRGRLPREVKGRALSASVKIPYHAALLDAGLSHRIVELADATLALIESHRFVAGALVARAAVETASLHYYAMKKILVACESKDIEEVTETLYRALTGSHAYGDGSVKPINVLTAIDFTDKTFKGVRSFYDQQSEYAHPNWFGAHGAFGLNEEEDRIEFGSGSAQGIEGQEVARGLALGLIVFDHSQRKLRNSLLGFAKVCDDWYRDHGA